MTCERASRKAREALLDWIAEPREEHNGSWESFLRVYAWIEDPPNSKIPDPSAGNFVAVLEALDGEIAVEVTTGNDIFVIWRISSHSFGMVDTPSSDKDNHHDDLMRADVEGYIRRSDSVRLLHRSDTQELPGAVREAMEGER